MSALTHWLEDHMLACGVKSATGLDCPGCGMQRSGIALLKGDLMTSLEMYPALLPLMGMFLFLALHVKFDFEHGAAILKWMFIGNTVIIFASWFLKLFG